MQLKLRLFLLLVTAVCMLSFYSCLCAVPAALALVPEEPSSIATYRHSIRFIKYIEIYAEQADICFYTDSGQEEIIIHAVGATLELEEAEKTLKIKNKSGQQCQMEICLPQRFYSIFIDGKQLHITNVHTMRGDMTVQADYLQTELDGYCGKIDFSANNGSVKLQNGKLQKTSQVVFAKKGNIYLDSPVTDTEGISVFSTGEGVIKIKKTSLKDHTFFEVSALSVFGVYTPLETVDKDNFSISKVQILSKSGIVYFIE